MAQLVSGADHLELGDPTPTRDLVHVDDTVSGFVAAASAAGVVIRVRNAAPYVLEAVASVLDQTRPPEEVIIVDGESTDGSIEALAPIADRIRVIPQRREGLGGAAQDGIDVTSQAVIAFQHADDIWPRDRLKSMVDALSTNGGWAGVMGASSTSCRRRSRPRRQRAL